MNSRKRNRKSWEVKRTDALPKRIVRKRTIVHKARVVIKKCAFLRIQAHDLSLREI